jgi:hypothetical protein
MSGAEPDEMKDIRVDAANLYREETFTDLRIATIRRLTPVKPDGSPDDSRDAMFLAQTHVMTQAGPVPVQARLEATTLPEAMEKFPEAIQAAMERMVEEVRELQRREASRIVVPRPGQGPLPGQGPGTIQTP